ncbi:glycoside hydrolase domain-containing protein, partial [Persicitalea sp.]|uniref:glycoside hydrolase domain-containing protein n=1 Tax=Persicitalea sp. TaxID=3100273 RepID=UPI00359364CF
IMVGDPALMIFGSGYAMGAKNFDVEAALDLMKSQDNKTPSKREYMSHGMVEGEVSITLEYMIGDFTNRLIDIET